MAASSHWNQLRGDGMVWSERCSPNLAFRMKHRFVEILKVPVPDRGQRREERVKMNGPLSIERVDGGQLGERVGDLSHSHSRWTQHRGQLLPAHPLGLAVAAGHDLEHSACSLLFAGRFVGALFQQRPHQTHRLLVAERVPHRLLRPRHRMGGGCGSGSPSICSARPRLLSFGPPLGSRLTVGGGVTDHKKVESAGSSGSESLSQ